LANVIAVGAISPCGQRKSLTSCDGETCWGSNYGTNLSVVAPGVFVPTTDVQGTAGYNPTDLNSPPCGSNGGKILNDYPDQNYIIWFNGTSAATPHVAGVAALILSVNPSLTGQQVRNVIEGTAQKVGGYNYQTTSGYPNGTWNNEVGYGLVNAYAAVAAVLSSSISGATDLCTTNPYSYSIANLPSTAKVTWKITSNRVILTQVGNVAYLQKNTNDTAQIIPGIDDGKITLQATITSLDGVTPVSIPTLYYTVYIYYPPANLIANVDNSGTYISFLLLYNTTQYQVQYKDLDNLNVQGYTAFTLPAAPVASVSYGSGNLQLAAIKAYDRFQFRVAGSSPCGMTDYSNWYTYTPPATITKPTTPTTTPGIAWSTTTVAASMSITYPCPASSCGVEQFNFPQIANAALYEITYTVINAGNIYTTGTFQTSSPPPYTGYVGGSNTSTQMSVVFKLRVQFTDGSWSDYATSSQYTY